MATVEDALLFDALLILEPGLPDQVLWQKKAHLLVDQYSRKKLKGEIEAVHQQLFNNPAHKSFRERILGMFK
jgi:hypothetical protein